jgi:hypothetical protein
MRFQAVATDFDGTIAKNGVVESDTIQALERWRNSGRLLLLVTGRELPDLKALFPKVNLFDCVVAENGALLYRPGNGEEELLCQPPPPEFIGYLHRLRVPLRAGRAVIATSQLYEPAVQAAIQELGIPWRASRNRNSLMVLPSAIDKHSGLLHALTELSIRPENVVAVGDAENDRSLLMACGWGVAVANAVPELKSCADLVTSGSYGAGVAELIEHLLANDRAAIRREGVRH